MDIVSAEGLVKKYGQFTAVDGISFGIPAGRCFGMLGPNGAGKTTSVRMIQCVSPRTDGKLTVFGLDPRQHAREIKARLGVCPQEDNLDPDFTVEKNLAVFARYYALPAREAGRRIGELLEFASLTERRTAKINELSGGMKRRLLIARALINSPSLLILDEPTTGLDPQARHLIWERVRELRRQGVTVILTTHYMEEAAQLCDQLLIIDQGRILEQGAPSDLVRQHIGREVLEIQEVEEENRRRLCEAAHAPCEIVGSRLLFRTERGDELLSDLREAGIAIKQYLLRPASLEDVFLRLTGRELRE